MRGTAARSGTKKRRRRRSRRRGGEEEEEVEEGKERKVKGVKIVYFIVLYSFVNKGLYSSYIFNSYNPRITS